MVMCRDKKKWIAVAAALLVCVGSATAFVGNYSRIIVGKRLSLGAGLILVLQAIFPMVLTAGAIKEAPGYAAKVMGL